MFPKCDFQAKRIMQPHIQQSLTSLAMIEGRSASYYHIHDRY
jgi:hypothetical protein